jgi:hypothetical protein
LCNSNLLQAKEHEVPKQFAPRHKFLHLASLIDLPFAALIIFFLLNAILIGQTLLAPDLHTKIPWLTCILAIGLSAYLWKTFTRHWPMRGLVVMSVTVLSLGLFYWVLVLLPTNGFVSKFLKLALVVFGVILQLPFWYHLGQALQSKQRKAADISLACDHSFDFALSAPQVIILWGALALVIFSLLAVSAYDRSDLLGWDTPTYIFRARLLERYGIGMHAQIGGGYQITFPLLCVAVHRLTGGDYFDIVRLLPAVLMALICLVAGNFTYMMVKSQSLAVLTALFTLAWGLSPQMIANLRDNITVTLFGILSLTCLAKSRARCAWLYELTQGVMLVLSGVSHLALSSVFFITTLHVNLMEFYDTYWLGERRCFFRQLWKATRVPLVSGLVVGAIWSSALLAFVNSLRFGLKTVAEAPEVRENAFSAILSRYYLTPNLPWILLGLAGVGWVIYTTKHSRGFKIVYTWSFIGIFWGVVLVPVSYLSDRFLMMTPYYLLIPFGIGQIWQTAQTWTRWRQIASQVCLLVVALGMLLPADLLTNARRLNEEIQGLPIADFERLKYASQYIESQHPPPPFIFLVESTSLYAEAYSALWQRIVWSVLPDEALVNTYLYFGTLDYLLRGEATPPTAQGLPVLRYEEVFTISSQRWFSVLAEDGVLENPRMTIFIVQAYNKDTFNNYLFLPMVDKIGPGILVVNVPDDSEY